MKKLMELSVTEFTEILTRELVEKTTKHYGKWVNRREACDLLNIGFNTLYKYIDTGMIARHKVGHKVLFLHADIEKLIESGKS